MIETKIEVEASSKLEAMINAAAMTEVERAALGSPEGRALLADIEALRQVVGPVDIESETDRLVEIMQSRGGPRFEEVYARINNLLSRPLPPLS